ncbi:hypothetical protein [Streptomyces sp. NPDC127114]|uniref:hypothetical protein n=1 Tax=Streptomyces sp. NPDC127114 TaxID=3345366 RepID=UPI003631E26B
MSRRNSARAAVALAAGLLSIGGLASPATAQTPAAITAPTTAVGAAGASSASAADYNLVYHRTFHGYTREVAWYQCNNAGQNGVRSQYWFVYECRSAGEITYDLYVAWTGSP